MVVNTIAELVDVLVEHPDEAFIAHNGEEALVFDTERDAILLLKGNFKRYHTRDEVAWRLRKAVREQHPITDEPTD